MRGGFNRLCEVAYGDRSLVGPPGVIYASDVPCRVVLQTQIEQLQWPLSLSVAWITLDSVVMNVPALWTPAIGIAYLDYLAADMVHVPDVVGSPFVVVRPELVNPPPDPAYERWLLVPREYFEIPPSPPLVYLPPLPPLPVPVPGASCSEATVMGEGTPVPFDSTAGEGWLRFVAPCPAGTYYLRLVQLSGNAAMTCYEGSCGSLNPLVSISGTDCTTLLLDPYQPLYFKLEGVAGPAEMTFEIGPGMC